MRSHQFAENLDVIRFTPDAIILRMRYYFRSRFACPADSKKGQALRARNCRLLTCKPWKR
jgi:hypothetical protein